MDRQNIFNPKPDVSIFPGSRTIALKAGRPTTETSEMLALGNQKA